MLGEGPSATATHLIPDLDHFSGRGAKDVIPLWRDKDAKDANITKGVLDVLVRQFRSTVLPEDLFAYCYAILSTPDYVTRLWDELTIPGPRLPIPKNKAMFEEGVNLGRQLLWLHTYGERFIPHRKQSGKLPKGKAKCKKGTSSNPQEYPDSFAYDRTKQELQIGNSGVFTNVRNEVWDYNISGLEVVNSWLSYRMKSGSGKTSSDLDKIRPKAWMFDEELLDLLWVLDATIDLIPIQGKFIKRIFKSKLFNSQDFPIPSSIEKDGPNGGNTPLFDGHSKIVDEEDAD